MLKIKPALLFFFILIACECDQETSGVMPEVKRDLREELQNLIESEGQKKWVCAHRANTYKSIEENELPENSLSAIDVCVELKNIEFVELDARQTADGVIVLMHDASVDRTTNGVGNVSEMSYDRIKNLKLKTADGKITNETVPTLKEALLKGKGKIFFNIDIANKNISAKNIVDLIKEVEMEKEVILYISDDTDYARRIIEQSNEIMLHPMIKYENQIDFFTNTIVGINIVQLSSNNLSASFKDDLIDKGILIFSNILGGNDDLLFAGSPSGIVKMINADVSIIQTDYPDLANTKLLELGYK